MKNLLKNEKGYRERNLLSLNKENENFDSIEFLWEIFEEKLSREEIFELFNEKDEYGNNILHQAAYIAKSKEIFEFLWLKIKKNFVDEEKLKSFLKIKGFGGRNVLLTSISKTNENSFFYIFEEIFCKLFDFKNFIYETDEDGENFLHFLARKSSVSMLNFAFKKLDENLSPEELQNFLRIKTEKYQFNLLHCPAAFSLNSCIQ
jgi:hypothetical protein